MSGGPITIKLRCASWGQLANIYKRDLTRSAFFLKAKTPPPLGTPMVIDLTLPSESIVVLKGKVAQHVPPGGLDGRGPGIDVELTSVPQSAMWMIESALSTARQRDTSNVRGLPRQALRQAERQRQAPPTFGPTTPSSEASLEDGNQLVEAEGQLISALHAELSSLRKLNPFQLLGVGYDTTDEAVRAAFAELTKRYHPDRFARYQSAEARSLASEIFILIRDAYRHAGSANARNQTLRALRSGGQPQRAAAPPPAEKPPAPAPAPVPKPKPAPTAAPTPAVKLPLPAPDPEPPARPAAGSPPPAPLAAGDLFADPRAPGESRPVDIPRADFNRPTGRVTTASLVEQGKYDQALAIYSLASRRNPDDLLARAGVELCHGLKALAEGDRLHSAQRFETVLELDPTNERAARELAEMRRHATNDRKGLLARLLGKKG